MFMMLIQSNPALMEQLGGSIASIQKELDKIDNLRKLKVPASKLSKISRMQDPAIYERGA